MSDFENPRPFRAMLPATCGVALALLTFEVAFRLLLFRTVSVDSTTHLPITIETHRLGEGFGVSHWDATGLRQSPHPCSRCPQVLVIGDSYTEALQVNDDQAYVAVAERILAAQKPVRLLNTGVASHSPADYIVEAASDRKRLQPAWVVIELNADDLGRDAFLPDKVHFREDGNALKLVVPAWRSYGWITRILGNLRERSALINYAVGRIDIARQMPSGPPWFRAGSASKAPVAAAAQVSYPIEAELKQMQAAYGNRITFLFLPLFDKPVEKEEIRFDLYCRTANVSCVNFRASFDEFRRNGTAPCGFPNSRFAGGHLNPAGHAAVARLLASELRRLQQNGLF